MKKFLSILAIIFFSEFSMFAQEETLIGNGEVTNGGFGGPVVKFTQIKGEPGVLVGGRGGWIINHTFVLGGGGYGLVNDIKADIPVYGIYSQPFINFGYGGFEMEYIINSDQLLHFSVSTLIGGGGVSYRNNLWDDNEDWGDWDSPHDAFFVFEPSANLELNIISFFRINAGISYRFISGVNFDDLKNKDLAGFSAVLTFKFGKF
ncbi:MAG TPA: hypothetical protein VMT35_02650 [Ignavibacteriaceae bacterium]|nr:hypothetical protein [Ignavibacteriaceae bacterium]